MLTIQQGQFHWHLVAELSQVKIRVIQVESFADGVGYGDVICLVIVTLGCQVGRLEGSISTLNICKSTC